MSRPADLAPGRPAPGARPAWRAAALFLLLAAGCAGTPEPHEALPGVPDPSPGDSGDDGGAFLVFENDVFAGEDDNYTNGVTIGATTPDLATLSEGNLLRRYARLFHWLPEFGDPDPGRQDRISFAIAHSMFTPADISDPVPPPDDQPYAGIGAFDQAFLSGTAREEHAFLLRLGWVGPRTRAEEIQKEVHEIIGSDEPQGWATQLPDEGIINLGYEFRREVARASAGAGAVADVTGMIGGHLGNYFTGAVGGFTGRIGWNLSDAVRAADPRRSFRGESVRCGESGRGWRLGLSAGVEGTAILHYLPLDGTLFHDSASVDDRAPLVAGATLGLDAGWGPFGIWFGFSKLTETFEAERSDNEFGTVVIGFGF